MTMAMQCEYDDTTKQEGLALRDTVTLGPTEPQSSVSYYRLDAGLPYIAPRGRTWDEQDATNTSDNTTIHRSMVQPTRNFVTSMNHYSVAIGDSDYGRVDWIGHLGTGPGSDRDTLHWALAAIDISYVHWSGGNISKPNTANSEVHDLGGNWRPTTHRRLVAVEACLRKWFGYVLNRNIDGHDDHFHVDLGTVPGHLTTEQEENVCSPALRLFRSDLASGASNPTISQVNKWKYTSCAYFVADCVNAFTDIEVPYNGSYDEENDGDVSAFEYLLAELGMECLDPIRYLSHYQLFLNFVIMHGLADKLAAHFRFEPTAPY